MATIMGTLEGISTYVMANLSKAEIAHVEKEDLSQEILVTALEAINRGDEQIMAHTLAMIRKWLVRNKRAIGESYDEVASRVWYEFDCEI